MDERPQTSAGNSRKRLRAEDRSGSSYKLATSPSMPHVRETRPRSGSASGPNEVMIPTSSENAPALQPLHPPIPNFSAISQGAPRPNSVPVSSGDPPSGMIYNIALPLPNPGRAHRFCQACDHINHVRRKLCENCGAPKPSAVRNAVGVRSVNETDGSTDRRPRPAASDAYAFEGLQQGYPRAPPYTQVAGQSVYSRPSNHNILPTDQRNTKSVDPVIHQAHPLTMRCPGDDIPLLGNTQRTHSSYQFSDSHASQRLGIGQALLSEPLINFGAVQNQDPRHQRAAVRPNLVGGAVDFNQKVFPGYVVDRDQIALPSMNGISTQQQPQLAYPGQSGPPRRISQLELSSHQAGLHPSGKGPDGAITEEVISLTRNNFIHELDSRNGASRFQNLQGLRQSKPDTNPQFPESLDGHGTAAYTYPSGQELFHSHSQVRQEDRSPCIPFDESRVRDGLGTSEPIPVSKASINLTRYMEHNPDGVHRQGDDRSRGAVVATNRGEVMHTGQLHRVPEHPVSGHLDETTRHTDEGRYAIENILMQHKNGRSNQGDSYRTLYLTKDGLFSGAIKALHCYHNPWSRQLKASVSKEFSCANKVETSSRYGTQPILYTLEEDKISL